MHMQIPTKASTNAGERGRRVSQLTRRAGTCAIAKGRAAGAAVTCSARRRRVRNESGESFESFGGAEGISLRGLSVTHRSGSRYAAAVCFARSLPPVLPPLSPVCSPDFL